MEKRKPHFGLAELRAAFADPAVLNRTLTAAAGAEELGMDEAAVAGVIKGLSMADFDKSITSRRDHRVWQDVYRPRDRGRRLYVKFTLDGQGALLLISFKEA